MKSRRKRKTKSLAVLLAIAMALTVAACSSDDGEVVTLSFLQFKGEALEQFETIIDEFEAENPDIRVIQNQVADADTTIRTLLVKDRAPDVITLNANGGFGKLATAGVFHDFTGDPVLETINPAVQEILADLGNKEGEVNSLGYINNANGIIYNTKIFEEQGLDIPETWEELFAACDQLQTAGITPFYGTLADAWTVLPSFNAIGAYAAQDGFFDTLRSAEGNVGPTSEVSFTENFAEVMQRQAELFAYAQDGYRGQSYDDGNAAFARGEVAMYMQGIWALAPIQATNPDIEAAIFPYPALSNVPEDRLLVTGVDVTVTIAKDTPHLDEALRFVRFMFEKDVISELAESQNMVPSVIGAELSDNAALQAVAPYFEEGRIAGFIDHQVPAAVPLEATVQQALFNDAIPPALATLDNEWSKVAARTITGD